MTRLIDSKWRAVLVASLSLAACGDDNDNADGGADQDHEGDHDSGGDDDAGVASDKLSFFVTSDTSMTGNLGGLSGADQRCNKLAKAVGSKRKFAAYLSTENNTPTSARDRIGKGPWYNAKGAMLAKDVAALHALTSGDSNLFIDEQGKKVNGQWEGSPTPNQHDILTGSDAQGRVVAGKTCSDWTSSDSTQFAQVGHSDGLGPMRNPAPQYASWNSSHESAGCNDTAPRGGAGKFYCFATD